MDAIDNSAGVDCSDHEVNIKILLDAIVADGDLTEKQRNELLAEMTDEVAELVLRDNYEQTQAISTAVAQAAPMVDVHERYLRSLELAGKLDRALEFLPDDETLAERKAAGSGLTAPEFAIVLSYTKIALYDELLASDVPDERAFAGELERYFPTALRERFPLQLTRHPLRREIVAAQLTNGLVNRAGTSFVFRLREETGATGPDIVRAFASTREIFDLRGLWGEIEALDDQVAAQTQIAMFLKARVLFERTTRWLLRNRPRPLDVAATISHFRPGADILAAALPNLLPAAAAVSAERAGNRLAEASVPTAMARRIAHLEALVPALDLVEIASAQGVGVEEAAEVYFALSDRLELHVLQERISALPREERWGALARRALSEDLQSEQRALTADVLRETAGDAPAPDRVASWLARNAGPVDRYLQILAEAKAGGTFDLATLSVAVREIRNLIEASVATAQPVPAVDSEIPTAV